MISKNIAIIPARSGSKRIPKKNIREFCGKPIIAYSIIAAKESGLFDHIIVSTDSEEVAQIASKWGADVPFIRPKELADDFTGTDSVLVHGIQEAEKVYGHIDYACCIYATVPLLRYEYLRQGFELLKKEGANVASSVTTYPFPIFLALHKSVSGIIEWEWPQYAECRSQDLPSVFHDAGQFYWVDAQKFKVTPSTLHNAVPVLLPRLVVQDIDTIEDWHIAEKLFNLHI